MRLSTTVTLGRQEAATLARAYVHIAIAYPEVGGDPTERAIREATAGPRAVRHLIDRQPGPIALVERAWRAMFLLREVCQRESTRVHWETELRVREQSEHEMPQPTLVGQVGIIAPGTDIIGVLAETRASQFVDAEAALDVLGKALGLLPEEPTEWDDDDA